MKQSRYTFLLDLADGKALLFCSSNGALAEIDRDSYPLIKQLLTECHPPVSADDRKIWDALVENGFLVEDQECELSTLEDSSHTGRRNSDCLALTIAPTLACNFACDYCFESHSAVRMSDHTEQAVLTFTERHLGNANSLLITWFGGEPTLCVSTIERLQTGFAAIADRRGIALDPGSIITNGYLLDRTLATRLKNLGVTTAQVTLDGPRQKHDQRRMLRNGRGTFDKILDNVTESCEILDIVIRINVDKDNLDSAVDVVQELRSRSIDTHVNVHFAQVTASGAACASVRDRCFTDREFSQSLVRLYHRLFELGIHIVDYPEVFSGGHCGAVSKGCHVISPTGLLFQCWEELSLDPKHSTGNIFSDGVDDQQSDNLRKYQSWDPFAKSECRKCDIMPICMGGCPLHGLYNNDANKGACSPFKHNLKDMLILRYLHDAQKEVRL